MQTSPTKPVTAGAAIRSPNPVSRLVRIMRRLVFSQPALYLPLRELRQPGTTLSRDTQLVIEGFPRCGNSWTLFALLQAQTTPVRLAHHSHAPAHVKLAVSRSIPTLVLFREPDAAVVSMLTVNPRIMTAQDAFEEYVAFYGSIASLRNKIVMASFQDVTKRLGRVVEVLNARFGLSLTPFVHTPENEAAAFELMDQRGRETGRQEANGSALSNPARRRDGPEGARAAAEAAILHPSAAKARARAKATFASLRSDIPEI